LLYFPVYRLQQNINCHHKFDQILLKNSLKNHCFFAIISQGDKRMDHSIEKVSPDIFIGKEFFDSDSIFKNGLPIFINKAIKQRPPDLQIHYHDFIEIAYVYSGTGTHQIMGESIDISKGDLFLINPNIPHRFLSKDSYADDEFVIYNFDFAVDLISEANIKIGKQIKLDDVFLYSVLFDKSNTIPYYHIQLHGNDLQEIEQLYEKAYNEFHSHNVGYENIMFSYLMILLVSIFRIVTGNAHKKDGSKYRNDIIKNALKYIDDNFANPDLSLDTLANQCFMSKNYFAQFFKETTGQKFTKYVQNKRISYACELLISTDDRIVDIINKCGYRDIKYFNELFKNIVGKTPSEYRKINSK